MNIHTQSVMSTMQNETSEDLLVIISMKEDAPQDSASAFEEFFQRFKDFTWKMAYTISKGVPCPIEDLAGVIFSNTFLIINKKAGTYNPAKGSSECLNSRIELWLSSIMRNEFRKLLNGHNEKEKNQEQYLEVVSRKKEVVNFPEMEPDDSTIKEDSIEKGCLEYGLKNLSERERDILLTYTRYAEGKKQLPKNELSRLATLYKTTSENLRQIKGRAYKKLKKNVKECSENKKKQFPYEKEFAKNE